MGQKQIDKILELAQEFFQHWNGLKYFQRIAESAEGLKAVIKVKQSGRGNLPRSPFNKFPRFIYLFSQIP